MIKPKMTWEPAKTRWRKMFRGKIYTISCDALGCPGTKAESYQEANAWWNAKKAEIDNQQPVGKWSHEIKTLEQRRNWLLAHGQSDQAAGYTSVIEDLSDGTMDDLHPSIVGELVHPGDRLDAVWQDRLSRDDSLVPQERLMSLSFTGRMGTTLGDQWVPPERLRRGLFDHSRDQASSPAGLATTS